MEDVRTHIRLGDFSLFKKEFIEKWSPK